MTTGISASEFLQDYTSVLKEHAKSFSVLQRHYVPHILMSPMDLKTIFHTDTSFIENV